MTREWLEVLCAGNTIFLIAAIVRLNTLIWSLRKAESKILNTATASSHSQATLRTTLSQMEEEILWRAASEHDPYSTSVLQTNCITSLRDILKLSDSEIQDICTEAGFDSTLASLLTLDENSQVIFLRALTRSQRLEFEKALQRRAGWSEYTRQMRDPTPENIERSCQTIMALAQKRISS